jgi:phenylpropionate dioxygenase-like ring-hydroxylating dioxygenase large terminal subunit
MSDEVAPYRFEELKPLAPVQASAAPLNWKTIADNYSDHLHIPVGHPGLTAPVRQELPDRGEGLGRQDGRRPGRQGIGQSVRTRLSALPAEVDHLPRTHQRKWLYYKLFPERRLRHLPDQVDFMQFLPVSATETLLREISYALPDDRREMKAARYLNWRINRGVNAEDTELITRRPARHAVDQLRSRTLGHERSTA